MYCQKLDKRFAAEGMWFLCIVILIFTTDLTLADASVFGSINNSPEDEGRATVDGVRSLDFVDTKVVPSYTDRGQSRDYGRKEGMEMEADVFSKLKHLPMHNWENNPSLSIAPSAFDIAELQRSLATVLQVLRPFELRQKPAGNGPTAANFLLHGKLVEIGPGFQGSVHEPLAKDRETVLADNAVPVGQKRAAALRSTVARRSHILPTVTGNGGGSSEDTSFMPSISVGALTNLGDFFQNLKQNLESLESKNLNHEQVKLLEGQNMISHLRKEFVEDYPKPAGSAAFLHAIRNYRPSHRIRALVSTVPELYRGTNYHDPVYMLAGLGK
ncbi:uncharacterized protein LOC128267882 [Anopheles cruzii]|uniref:uncharacterized protein LOC128267882 n=1 Tax=Anopheles cruzii TaxID=68878 RepID=UPI0022EC3699|nr:uncharacterized protein LOC128267882 [Anopheles cruzii]